MKLDLKAPHQKYTSADGTPLPGVTTICGVMDKPPLRNWTGVEEREGILRLMGGQVWTAAELRRVLPRTKEGKPALFADAKRDRAADLGTITHARCHAHDLGEELELDGLPSDLYEQSQHGLDRYVAWVREQSLALLACEKQVVYENALDSMRYGGTIDRLFVDKAMRKVLVDLKTSKASAYWPYDETFSQVCAYAEAEGEVDRIIVVRIGKEPGDEIQVYELNADERRYGWALFCGAYAAYEAKKALAAARRRR